MYFNQTEVGQRVRDLRNSHGMTAEELSEKLDYSHSHVSKVESGQHCYSMDFLICLAQYFDVSLDYLILGRECDCTCIKRRMHLLIKELDGLIDRI